MTYAKNGERAWRTSYTCSEFQILLTSVVMYIRVTGTSGHGCYLIPTYFQSSLPYL